MKNLFKFILAVALIQTGNLQAQQTPGDAQSGAISITGVTAHVGDGTVVENATIVFDNGVITAFGDSSTPTQGTVVDASGKHLYPGIIAPAKSLGLV